MHLMLYLCGQNNAFFMPAVLKLRKIDPKISYVCGMQVKVNTC